MFVGSPALLALLGLAAFSGLRSAQRASEIRNDDGHDQARPTGPWAEGRLAGGNFGGGFGGVLPGGVGGGFVFDLGDLFDRQPRGVVVSGGLRDLIRQLEAAGYREAAQSWVSDGPNQPVRPEDVEQALDEDLLLELEQRTGLPRAEILERLATGLPETVSQLTPQGRVPTDAEAEQFVVVPDRVDTPQEKSIGAETQAEAFIVGPDGVELKEPGSDR